MKHAATLLLILLGLVPILVLSVAAPATYSLTVNPGVPVSRGTTVTLILSLTGAQRNTAYGVSISVDKPNGTGLAYTSRIIVTNNAGVGSTAVPYPDPSFTAVNGTVATDVGGVYTVRANQTSPSFLLNVATTTFTVTSQLTVVLTQPTSGIYVQRGQAVTITASVSDLSGPITSATAYANTPVGGIVYLAQTNPGVYSATYQMLLYDPVGPWTIQVSASDTQGNSGVSNTVTVTVTKTDLIVDSLAAYNAKGLPTTDFLPGDTIFPYFRIRYSSGTFLTMGQFRVAIKNPSGAEVANLTAVYDPARFGFSTPAGYQISSNAPIGPWAIAIDGGSADDGYGNTGPNFTTSITIQVASPTSTWTYLPIVIGSLLAALFGAVAFKKYDRGTMGFEYLDELMGGPLPRGSSLLLLGDPGSGKTLFSYQFLYDELENNRKCALLSYDAFPEDIQSRMKEFGWDITSHLRKGRLKIIDCYSGLAGEGEGAIKDPSDLTELNIRVTSIIVNAKGSPVTLALDSLTPIFNGVDPKQAIMFLQTVAAKIKKTGGIFFMTGTTGAIAGESLAKLKSMVDGLIELTRVHSRRHATRYLSVVKMERRKISSEAVPFEIDRKRGFVFRVSRLKNMVTRKPETEPKPESPNLAPKMAGPKLPPRPTPPRFEAKPATTRPDRGPTPIPDRPGSPASTIRSEADKLEEKPHRNGLARFFHNLGTKLTGVPVSKPALTTYQPSSLPANTSIRKPESPVKTEQTNKPSQGTNAASPSTDSKSTDKPTTAEAKDDTAKGSGQKSNAS